MLDKLRDYLRLRAAKNKADKLHRENGQRYYVMPSNYGGKIRLVIVDRKNFRLLKRKGFIHHRMTLGDALSQCIYHTPHAGGLGRISPERELARERYYYSWAKAMRKMNKRKREVAKITKGSKEAGK